MRRIFSLLLIVALCSAMSMVVKTQDGTAVLSSQSLAVKVNTQQDTMDIGGTLTVPMFPTIRSKGKLIEASPPKEQEFTAGEETSSYSISYPENFAGDVFASVDIEVTDDYVSQVIHLENSGEKDLTVEIEVLPTNTGKFYVFAPYKRDPNTNYLWFSPPLAKEKADGVVVTFDNGRPSFDQPLEINQKNSLARVLAWNVQLAAGEKKDIGMKYASGYVNDESLFEGDPYSPSYSKQYLLNTDSEPLFKISGSGASNSIKPGIDKTATGTDVLDMFKQTLNSIKDTPTSESTLATLDVDLNSAVGKVGLGLNSIEKALLFREMSRGQGIPCEIVVGYKDGNYYAWAVSYLGLSKFKYDPAGKSNEYKVVYTEPEPPNCRGDMHSCPWSVGIRTDLVCLGPICMSAYVLIGLLAAVAIAIFALFQYKTDVVYKMIGLQKGKKTVVKDNIDGAYNIINEKFVPKDPLEAAVWNALRRRGGTFNSDDYVTETGFSEMLLKSTMEKLAERGVIRRMK